MKKIIPAILVLVVVAFACEKNNFQSKPQLTIKSTNGPVIPKNGSLRVDLEYTDKEGDVNDTLYIIRQRLNKRQPLTSPPGVYKVPDFPHTPKGEIAITLDYPFQLTSGFGALKIPGTSNPDLFEPDTMKIKFVLKDKANNISDTAVVDVIVIR